MTGLEAMLAQAEASLGMVLKCFAGVEPGHLDFRAHPSMMSVREHVAHLTECNLATKLAAEGTSYEWGSYIAPEDYQASYDSYLWTRSEALALADDTNLDTYFGYIVTHEYYHIGQLAATRQAFDPEWSSFSLYS